MGWSGHNKRDLIALEKLIEEITVDAYGEDEKFWAFRQEFEDNVAFPVDGFVIGEPVTVVEIDYDGDERHGLTMRCRREDGSEYLITARDVVFPDGSNAALYQGAYRRWLNLDPYPSTGKAPRHKHRVSAEGLDLSQLIELVALSVMQRAVRCRLLGGEQAITLRPSRFPTIVPGEIITVRARKQWHYGGHPYLSGEIQSARLDVNGLGLAPLALKDEGIWDPDAEYWGEEDEPIEAWAQPIIAHGPRPQFEMEQILPGEDPEDPFSDPITESTDLKNAGDLAGARKMLMDLCQADLRCLDAHSHLGNIAFNRGSEEALRHYGVGFRIGELSLTAEFDGVLPWGLIDNRPFLRNMHGYGLCLWRLGRFEESERIFERMLWLNPSDNQGIRFLINEVRARIPWEDRQDD